MIQAVISSIVVALKMHSKHTEHFVADDEDVDDKNGHFHQFNEAIGTSSTNISSKSDVSHDSSAYSFKHALMCSDYSGYSSKSCDDIQNRGHVEYMLVSDDYNESRDDDDEYDDGDYDDDDEDDEGGKEEGEFESSDYFDDEEYDDDDDHSQSSESSDEEEDDDATDKTNRSGFSLDFDVQTVESDFDVQTVESSVTKGEKSEDVTLPSVLQSTWDRILRYSDDENSIIKGRNKATSADLSRQLNEIKIDEGKAYAKLDCGNDDDKHVKTRSKATSTSCIQAFAFPKNKNMAELVTKFNRGNDDNDSDTFFFKVWNSKDDPVPTHGIHENKGRGVNLESRENEMYLDHQGFHKRQSCVNCFTKPRFKEDSNDSQEERDNENSLQESNASDISDPTSFWPSSEQFFTDFFWPSAPVAKKPLYQESHHDSQQASSRQEPNSRKLKKRLSAIKVRSRNKRNNIKNVDANTPPKRETEEGYHQTKNCAESLFMIQNTGTQTKESRNCISSALVPPNPTNPKYSTTRSGKEQTTSQTVFTPAQWMEEMFLYSNQNNVKDVKPRKSHKQRSKKNKSSKKNDRKCRKNSKKRNEKSTGEWTDISTSVNAFTKSLFGDENESPNKRKSSKKGRKRRSKHKNQETSFADIFWTNMY